MRLSTRSVLSPGRNPAAAGDRSSSSSAVATTLSRRLRRNGSLRGGAQSPALFPATASTTKKSRGSSAFAENPEPSSPKVTCIGQVRVKTKKQGKKMKLRACGSKRIGGEASFRRVQPPPPSQTAAAENLPTDSPGKNPRWVHLPLSICEALNCLLPCKSSCFSNNNNNNRNNEERENNNGGSSCGRVLRWLVSVQEGEEGRRRDIELVVEDEVMEEEEERIRVMERVCSRRRSIFDGIEFDDLFNSVNNNVGTISGGDGEDDGEVEGGRVSVCVPPKNALLLMRCKSDPLRMASLSRKFLEASFGGCDGGGDGGEGVVEVKEETVVDVDVELEVMEEEKKEIVKECVELDEVNEGISEDLEAKVDDLVEISEEFVGKMEEIVGKEDVEVEEKPGVENRDETEEEQGILGEEMKENRDGTEEKQSVENVEKDEEVLQTVEETEVIEGGNERVLTEEEVIESEIWQILVEMPNYESMEVEEESKMEESREVSSNSLSEELKELDRKDENVEVVKEVVVVEDEREGRQSMEKEVNKSILPDCLLLMMCEPKLSMEVSKETWVCRSDFIRCLPERHHNQKPNKTDGPNEQTTVVSTKKTKPAAVAAQPPVPRATQLGQTGIRPGRSSISFPTGGSSVANVIEQKLAKAGAGYEPFVLPRCKSAPMRSAAKFGNPELACSMLGRENGRKLEPHRPATCGVGAAGVGF
ncbi:hypothetical protein RND81_09G016200 [Saponaria officinalis]